MKIIRPDFLFKQSICSQGLWCHWRMTVWRDQPVILPLRSRAGSWIPQDSRITFASRTLQGERKSHQSFSRCGSCPAPSLLWGWSRGGTAVSSCLCGSKTDQPVQGHLVVSLPWHGEGRLFPGDKPWALFLWDIALLGLPKSSSVQVKAGRPACLFSHTDGVSWKRDLPVRKALLILTISC